MLTIKVEQLNALYQAISSSENLVLPIKKGKDVDFALYKAGETVSLETLKTAKSPKDVFFPQSENLMKFKTVEKNLTVSDMKQENAPTVLFGVKGCDLKGIEVLDKVFLAEPIASYYKARREATTIVSLACSNPSESCFCTVVGIDPTAPIADVTTWLIGDNLYWKATSEKGETLTEKVKHLFEEAKSEEVEKRREETKRILEVLPFAGLDLSRFKGENLNELFDAPEWEELSEACLGCGACTFVCPTCQCYDIRDCKTKDGVVRYRCWDSCMYSDFTLMAHGNSRTTQLQRYRQRFMHKLVYYPSQQGGLYSCVGCGRCVEKCPQNLNIVKVIKALGGKKND